MRPEPPPTRGQPDRTGPKPTPVRVLQEAPPAPAEAPVVPVPLIVVSLDGVEWSVRVEGQSGGPGTGPAGDASPPLLFVRFERDGDDAATSGLGAWVVGTRLEDVSEARLEAALRNAKPWTRKAGPDGFFEDEGGRRGR